MFLGDPPAYPETESRAIVALCRVEHLEDVALHLGRHPRSGVGNRDADAHLTGSRVPYQSFSHHDFAALAGRVECIAHEICEDLAKFSRITKYRAFIGVASLNMNIGHEKPSLI